MSKFEFSCSFVAMVTHYVKKTMYFILVREMYFLSSVLKFLAYVAFLRFYALNEDFLTMKNNIF